MMNHQRKSIRLQGFDYASVGAYFVTICTNERACLFGEIIDGKIILNEIGKMVQRHWNSISKHFQNVIMDEFIMMPNHMHRIITIFDDVGAKHSQKDTSVNKIVLSENASPLQIPAGTKHQSLSAIVQNFKSITSRKFNKMKRTSPAKLWQRNYYEHVIRDEDELKRIREYIFNNPLKWELDKENPANWNNVE